MQYKKSHIVLNKNYTKLKHVQEYFVLCSKYEKAEYVVKKRFIDNRHETVPVGTGTLYTTAQTTKALSQKCFTRAH